jgi:hypothetical protein
MMEKSVSEGELSCDILLGMKRLVTITKADGTQELFEEEKLAESLRNAGGDQVLVEKILVHTEKEIHDGMPTSEIFRHAFHLLRKHSLPVAIKYSLRRALSELGPDGFSFEKYIARIFQAWGYESLTDQTVFGGCVAHEVDVVAWTKDKLIFVEAKFHNEFVLKSDLKVVLYVKARFDDLKENSYDYGGMHRTMSEGWLITNTKFTDQAVKYGECKGVKMIGWNYPPHGNLQDIIEELRLHPFTCLTTLSNVQKKMLLAKNVVLCKDVLDHPNVLKEIGLPIIEAQKVFDEARQVCGVGVRGI